MRSRPCSSGQWSAFCRAYSLIAVQESQDLGIRNLILSSPCVGLTVEVPVVKEVAARVLSRIWG
ncbi:MAG: hypothetical protein EB114_06375, partial [Betaproteobacteria bacterium]|nr:hypothetical protein [Betaproteobacteria bacterium]